MMSDDEKIQAAWEQYCGDVELNPNLFREKQEAFSEGYQAALRVNGPDSQSETDIDPVSAIELLRMKDCEIAKRDAEIQRLGLCLSDLRLCLSHAENRLRECVQANNRRVKRLVKRILSKFSVRELAEELGSRLPLGFVSAFVDLSPEGKEGIGICQSGSFIARKGLAGHLFDNLRLESVNIAIANQAQEAVKNETESPEAGKTDPQEA